MRYADRDLILTAADRRISRCTCGSWVWDHRACSVCATALALSTPSSTGPLEAVAAGREHRHMRAVA